MKILPLPSQARLQEVLSYEPSSGVFTWKLCLSNKAPVGSVAGALNGDGAIRVTVDGHRYLAHRLAWKYVFGVDPRTEIDHINRVRTDNRIENLREATHTQNLFNAGKRRRPGCDMTLPKGCSWDRKAKRYEAYVTISNKKRHLGYFISAEEAGEAYNRAASALHGNFALLN